MKRCVCVPPLLSAFVLVYAVACSRPGARADRDAIARGAAAIERHGCGSCHTIPGIDDARATVGPPLDQYAKRVFIAGRLPNSPDSLAQWIMRPQFYAPGVAMPDLHVSAADAHDIAAYLYAR